jgi:predicted short-subunit dehydrogenase-like oxidoreductase (DUF2520 family)
MVNESRFIWITTNDDAIESVANQIAELNIHEKKTFIHASGLKTSDVLISLKKQGHETCSVHPLLAFSTVEQAVKMLGNTTFFLEGEPDDLLGIKQVFEDKSLTFAEIKKEQKAAYHAGACMISNYLVTLVHASNQLFELAGISNHVLSPATNTLMASVLQNLEGKGPKEALTGPIKRGDVQTVKKHLEILAKELPRLTEVYKVLGKETMHMIDDFRLKNIFDE